MTELGPRDAGHIHRSYLSWVTMQHRAAEAAIANRVHAIAEARLWGASWQELGDAMSMSRQTAHKRFARLVNGGRLEADDDGD